MATVILTDPISKMVDQKPHTRYFKTVASGARDAALVRGLLGDALYDAGVAAGVIVEIP